jgi:hypothetical protein
MLGLKLLGRLGPVVWLTAALAVSSPAAIVVTSPAAQKNVKSCNEYATDVLHDPWDMSRRTDLGWRIYNTVEEPKSYLSNISFSGGIFSAKTGTNPNIFILDSHYPGSIPDRYVGASNPINADKYTMLVIRGSFDPTSEILQGQLLWSKNTIYSGSSVSYPFKIYQGWTFYYVDIPSLALLGSDAGPWSGQVDSLRVDPINESNRTVQIDWIRIVEKDDALRETISWSGSSGNVDVYLDNNANPGDGTLGFLAKNVAGTSYSFLAGGLAPGDYYAVVVPTGTSPTSGSARSAGFYRINDTPVLTFTKPTAAGSTEDFATVTFGNPWDLSDPLDVEYTHGVVSSQYTTLNYYDLAGNLFTNRTVYKGSSVSSGPGLGDPYLNFLYWDQYSRGRNRWINADRYHNLVATFGVAGAWNVLNGSIARAVWKRQGETAENVSEDIIIRQLNNNTTDWGQTVLNTIVFDMKTLPLESDPGGSPSRSGWGGWVDGFRLDPHEFSEAREFYFDDVKLTADWRADTSFPITWQVAHADGTTTTSLYYDTNGSGFDGTLIASGLTGTSTTWNCSAVPEGTYWIYAVYTDGTNGGRRYAGGPVVVEHHAVPQIRLSKYVLNFGVVGKGPATGPVEVILSNAGTGTLNWTVSIRPDTPFLKVSPMSGTGNKALSVWIDPATLPDSGPFWGTITVFDPAAWNSPQVIEIWGTVYPTGTSAAPFGDFSTPAGGTTGITGAFPVTGWVLDDVETSSVKIYREPVGSDPPAVIGPNGKVFIGDALFVEGARPDVEDAYPAYPLNSRAGWGYMLLSNFLPNGGNGTFTLYAIATDEEGHAVTLGAKTIGCDNAHATKPFGTIDTPAQGGMASGSPYVVFGWVLTPLPNTVPKDGSTITVYVDSVAVGTLSTPPNAYNLYRQDIADNFPGLNNSSGPVGAFYFDTTGYASGCHSISWIAYDNVGNGDGIGSRYFTISSMAGSPPAPDPAVAAPVDESSRMRIDLVPEEAQVEIPRRPGLKPALLKRGAPGGSPAAVEVPELGFVELRFRSPSAVKGSGEGGLRLIGWGRDESRPLPIGSTLDPDTGVFTWIPGPGFLGEHILHFALTDGERKGRPIAVTVRIVPLKPGR